MATFWEIAAHSVEHMFSLYFDYLLYPVVVLRAAVGFWLLQFLILAYVLLLVRNDLFSGWDW